MLTDQHAPNLTSPCPNRCTGQVFPWEMGNQLSSSLTTWSSL